MPEPAHGQLQPKNARIHRHGLITGIISAELGLAKVRIY